MKQLLGTKLYYGWYVIGVTMMGGFLAAGVSQLFMGVMLKPMTEDLGWSRTETAGAITLGTFAAGGLSPIVGWLVDRHGPRLLAPIGASIIVCAYIALANLSEIWHFYIAYFVGRGVAASTIGGVVSMTIAANWFRRKRGRALGLTAMAVPLGGAVLALLGQLIIELSGWRAVFATFGVLLAVLYIGPALLIIRRRPEDIGLLPDGETAAEASEADKRERKPERSWTLKEATRTRALWLLIVGLTIGTLANSAVGFHQVAYYTDQGLSPAVAATLLSVYAFSGAFANGIWGWMVERFSERGLVVTATALCAFGVLFLLTVDTLPEAIVFAIIFGMAGRGESSLIMMMLAQYYGRDSYGTISGFITPFQMVGLGLGPLLGSISYDAAGSYSGAFVALSGAYMVAAVFLFLARRPVAKDEPSPMLAAA
jgi:MFS family permease